MGYANSQTLPDLLREVEQGQAGGGAGLPVGEIVGGQKTALGSARRAEQRELAQRQHQLLALLQQQQEEQQHAAVAAEVVEGEEGSGGGWVAGPGPPDALLHVGDIGYDLQVSNEAPWREQLLVKLSGHGAALALRGCSCCSFLPMARLLPNLI